MNVVMLGRVRGVFTVGSRRWGWGKWPGRAHTNIKQGTYLSSCRTSIPRSVARQQAVRGLKYLRKAGVTEVYILRDLITSSSAPNATKHCFNTASDEPSNLGLIRQDVAHVNPARLSPRLSILSPARNLAMDHGNSGSSDDSRARLP